MRLLPLLFPLLLLSLASVAQNANGTVPQHSGQSHISLITCGPGEELYEGFGHTAIAVNS